MNEQMRKLVGKLDNTHKALVSEVTKKGGLSLKTASAFSSAEFSKSVNNSSELSVYVFCFMFLLFC